MRVCLSNEAEKDGRPILLREDALKKEGGRERRMEGEARTCEGEMYKGADDKTEVPANRMLQYKPSAHPRRTETKLRQSSHSHVFFERSYSKKG